MLDGYDREFYKRVWETDLEVFRNRLKAIAFQDLGHVLDAGSGNRQWTLCLTELNYRVSAVDVSQPRLDATTHVLEALGVENYSTWQESIDALTFPSESFDAVFCYSALYFTDHKKTLREFFRVLKPGGTLYACTNGPGWYIHNMIEPHNPSPHFDIRDMAVRAISNTIDYFASGAYDSSAQLAIPRESMGRDLRKAGFTDIELADEGSLHRSEQGSVRPFFAGSFHGMDGVYEFLATRPSQSLST